MQSVFNWKIVFLHCFMSAIAFKEYLDTSDLATWHRLTDSARRVVIVGHASPDGDAMGSALALALALQRDGRQVKVMMPNAFPDFLAWLPGAGEVLNAEYHKKTAHAVLAEADLLCCLDFNALYRTEWLTPQLERTTCPRLMIDHHLKPDFRGDLLVSDSGASSTCEIVFSLLWQLGEFQKASREVAECLYCGMMTDTGGFTYNSNRPILFQIIAELLAKGIDKDRIYRNVYHSYSFNRMRLQGYILYEKLVYFEEAHAALFTLTRDEMKSFQFKKGDAEGLVNLPLQIKGTRLCISLREDTEQPLIRVSLRSVDDYKCNVLAERFFNGGGHANAAGGRLEMTMDEAVEVARQAIAAFGEEQKEQETGTKV